MKIVDLTNKEGVEGKGRHNNGRDNIRQEKCVLF